MCGKQRTCGRGFLEVWQGKDLWVVSSDVWQIKDLATVATDKWRVARKDKRNRGAGGTRPLKGPGEERGMQEPHLQIGRLRRRRSRNTRSRGEAGKRKIVGTLKKEILGLAKLAEDDYPCRIVILAEHGAATLQENPVI